jgi:hypothetical protein
MMVFPMDVYFQRGYDLSVLSLLQYNVQRSYTRKENNGEIDPISLYSHNTSYVLVIKTHGEMHIDYCGPHSAPAVSCKTRNVDFSRCIFPVGRCRNLHYINCVLSAEHTDIDDSNFQLLLGYRGGTSTVLMG